MMPKPIPHPSFVVPRIASSKAVGTGTCNLSVGPDGAVNQPWRLRRAALEVRIYCPRPENSISEELLLQQEEV